MELLIIRHGQSEADILNCHEGRADFPLTELGVKQARLLAGWIAENYPPDFIISSTLKRAGKTAELLGLSTGIDVKYDEDLMEYNNGVLAGLPFEEAAKKYPIPNESDRAYIRFYGQETLIEFRARAETALTRIINEHPKESRIAVVSHGGMINMLFRSFMNLPVSVDYGIDTGDTAVHCWKLDGAKRRILFTNRMEHLRNLK